jgi:CPA1 family monovalent cation:H+ antiporter
MLLAVAALGSYLNHRFLRLPTMIGLMAVALAISLVLAVLRHYGIIALKDIMQALHSAHLSELVLHGALGYILFAGALHVDLRALRKEAAAVALLATVSVAITAAVAGTLFWAAARALAIELPYVHALLFGALIAPTDPIAVLGIMNQVQAPATLRVRVTGESLFNDGVGIVLFLRLLRVATRGEDFGFAAAFGVLLAEVVGGAAIGLAAGWAVYKLLATVDDYAVEILLTLGLASGVYALGELAHVSAPIATAVAGLLTGNHARARAMSEKTREHVDTFWELIDEILNAVLFVLIGLEVLVLHIGNIAWPELALAALAIPAVLLARFIGVMLPIGPMRLKTGFSHGNVPLLVWAGLRGGISIALALSLIGFEQRHLMVLATYAVVVFSVLVQGSTLGPLIARSRC